MSTITASKIGVSPRPESRVPVPPLASGDRLTHAEYIERYAVLPEDVKAERIEGVVYMAAAALSVAFHGRPHFDMAGWLAVYRAATPGIEGADNGTTCLDVDNDPQPDLALYVLPSHGGRVKMNQQGYLVGAPELIVEIAASSESYDLGLKQNVYRRNGVAEYIVHRTYDGEIDWFILREGRYEKLQPDDQGIIRSAVFPGLWLAVQKMVDGQLAEVLAVVQQGIASPEHSDFVKSMGQAKPI